MFYPQGRSTTRSMGELRVKIRRSVSFTSSVRPTPTRAFMLLTRHPARPRLTGAGGTLVPGRGSAGARRPLGSTIPSMKQSELPVAAYGANYERLVAIKAKYDPGNFFRGNQNVAAAA
jgi:berberine-like enzyme